MCTSEFVLPKRKYASRRRNGRSSGERSVFSPYRVRKDQLPSRELQAPEPTLPAAISTASWEEAGALATINLGTSEAGHKLSTKDQLDCTHVESTLHRKTLSIKDQL